MNKLNKMLYTLIILMFAVVLTACKTNDEAVSNINEENSPDFLIVESPTDDIENYFDFSERLHVVYMPSEILVNYGILGEDTLVYIEGQHNFLYVETDLSDSNKQLYYAKN